MKKYLLLILISSIPVVVSGCRSVETRPAVATVPPVLVVQKETKSELDELLPKLSIPVEKYVLANGLTVLLSEDHSTPFVAVNKWYHVGSINEERNKTGLAHLFEHLMFEGSRHVKAAEHFRRLENAGGHEINASTSFERTNYYQTVPKTQLELVLSLEASRMYFLVIDQQKLDEQRAVVRREREQSFEITPYGINALKLWQEVFDDSHPFHGRVIGSHKDLEAARLEDVQDFYDRFYGPTNATLAIVGDFDREQVKNLINKYFATLPRTNPKPVVTLNKVVIDQQEIFTEEEKVGKLPLVRIHYITPALYLPGDAEMDVVSHILTGSENGRLTKAITRDKQLASVVSASQQSFEQFSLFTISAMLNPNVKEEDVLKEIDAVLASLITTPPTGVEIDRARNAILTSQFFGLQSLGGYGGRAELLQTYNRYASNPNFIREDTERYRKVDMNSIVQFVARYLPVGTARKVLFAKPVSNHVARKGIKS